MGTQYSHLTLDERCRLRGLMEIGLAVTAPVPKPESTDAADEPRVLALACRSTFNRLFYISSGKCV